MAFAKKCDICGKFYDEYNVKNDSERTNGIMLINVDSTGDYFRHDAIDCCSECMNSIISHIEHLSIHHGVTKIEDK